MTWLVMRLLRGCGNAELACQSLQVVLPLISFHSLSVFLFDTGFFSPVPGSLLSQVGRGYTDLAAALLSAGLGAAELQIWKEVDGIFTADPRKVLTARLLPVISPEEAAELTYYGSEVVHPFTMEQARTKPSRNYAKGNPVLNFALGYPAKNPDSHQERREPARRGHGHRPGSRF